MVNYFLIGLIVLLVLVCLGQFVGHRRWEKRIDAQLRDAATRETWWRTKALQPKIIAPPPVPMTAEEWRSRAATMCAPVFHSTWGENSAIF